MEYTKINIKDFDILKVLDFYGISYNSRKKNTYVCNCIFHLEETPSMTIYTNNNTFYCFGCNASGNISSLIMKKENISFIQSLDKIKHIFNIQNNTDLKAIIPKSLPIKKEEKRAITDTFHDVYNDVLTYCKSIPNKLAIEYLENRCLKLEYLQDLNIQTFDTYLLSKYLKFKFDTDTLDRSGLNISLYNYQIVIPYYLNGKICNLQFRTIDPNHKPKYKFLSGLTRFNFNLDVLSKCKNKRVAITEGVFDSVALTQMTNEYDLGKYDCKGFVSFHSATVTDMEIIELLNICKVNNSKPIFFIDNDSNFIGLKLKEKIDKIALEVGIKVKYFMPKSFKDVNEFYINLKNNSSLIGQ
jgi:DNA primase